jgi:hypothetical protein
MRIVLVMMMVAVAAAAQGAPQSLSQADVENWIRYTVPLPKQIGISEKVKVRWGSVKVVKPEKSNYLTDQAVKELTELVGEDSGPAAFTIRMVVGGPGSEKFREIKNGDQAYSIEPTTREELQLVALTPRGLYYAAKTLQQLIAAKKTVGWLEMPLVSVLDWPDMEERGLWGSDNYEHLKWMGDRKMNHAEQIMVQGVDYNGRPYAYPGAGRMPLFTEAPLYGINPTPVSLHLEQVAYGGTFREYPECKAKDCEHQGVMCYSQPKTVEIIADWIAQLSQLPNVTSVDQWMSENLHNKPGCQCDLCKATGVDPMVLEARAIVKAWQMAEKKTGQKIDLRILTSEASEEFNKQIFAELPKGVKIVYYHSLLTYTCWHAPQLRKYLEDWAKAGNWLEVCPNVSHVPGAWMPFDSAQFVKYRMNEYTDKGLSGLLGYSVPRVNYCYYNTEAAAEYTWNANGRSPREFAVSWAVRNGIKDPEKFADYADAVGTVLWDCYGSDWPYRASNWIQDPIDVRLKEGKVPDFGYVEWDFITLPFGSIKSLQQLDDDVAAADKAVKLAQELRSQEYYQEARVARGLIRSLKALHELKSLVKDGKVALADRPAAQRYFQMYVDSLRETKDALPKWEATVRGAEKVHFTSQVETMIQEQLVDRMSALAKEMGTPVR